MSREQLQLLTEMLDLSKYLSNLDFSDEEHLTELARIQNRQMEIREQFERLTAGGEGDISPQLRAIAAEIINLETNNVRRMQEYKLELERTGRDIQSAKRVKSLYENSYIQGFGYFIDSHK